MNVKTILLLLLAYATAGTAVGLLSTALDALVLLGISLALIGWSAVLLRRTPLRPVPAITIGTVAFSVYTIVQNFILLGGMQLSAIQDNSTRLEGNHIYAAADLPLTNTMTTVLVCLVLHWIVLRRKPSPDRTPADAVLTQTLPEAGV